MRLNPQARAHGWQRPKAHNRPLVPTFQVAPSKKAKAVIHALARCIAQALSLSKGRHELLALEQRAYKKTKMFLH